ncbi:pimeloyl-ACP methyl ester carboxylesterase [Dyadobacter jejuensis]|uniref:Pimeloyl-ACP methyl ester carboxylesterase n=1 Tax=Dyadobacter jejuensis TaxID=1082580 RepID=A0A316AQ87_9BACT|nr:alpha/beta hydrolase [Dyadobacter jejuensis]PWJ59658.1 pimeloyl-ACP methyl ester carboxylesterase [Dyadobacter jejuensis]
MPTIETNGIQLHYELRGEGEPLLLIMGITAPGSVWEPHVADWQAHFQCIIADNRGVGFSDKPAGPYSSEEMADDYAGLLDHLGIQRVAVVGCSMGSIIAQQLAIRHPDKVKSLVLMCPWARCDAYAKGVFEAMVQAKARYTPEEFSLHIQLLIFSKSHWDKPEALKSLEEGRIADGLNPYPQPLHGLVGQAAACINHQAVAELSTIGCPTLVIGGKADIFTPVWMAQEVADGIAGSELFLYDDLGHAFHFENTPDFNPRVRQWLIDNG